MNDTTAATPQPESDHVCTLECMIGGHLDTVPDAPADAGSTIRKFDHANDTYAWSCSCGATSAAGSVTPRGRDTEVALHLEREHRGQLATFLPAEDTNWTDAPAQDTDAHLCNEDCANQPGHNL